MIGDTAAISALTGLPGSGKTLRCVQRMAELIEKGEHVYASNFTGITLPGITPWADPTKWEDLPAGAILFVDEAQHYFPARRAGEPASWVKALSTIRHLGVRLVLVTQQPDYLDSYVRGLIGFHEHLYRASGKSNTFIFRNNQLMENVRLPFKRIKATYDHERWSLPKKYFAFYKSAEIHTMSYRMPTILRRALIILPIAAMMFVGAWALVFKDTMWGSEAAKQAGEAEGAPASALAAESAPGAAGKTPPLTIDQFVQQQIPRLPNAPWSAPVFDESNTAQAQPALYCMSSDAGNSESGFKAASCTCHTEQGTFYKTTEDDCRHVARRGQAYNPYKEPDHRQRDPAPKREADTAVTRSTQKPGARTQAVGVGAYGWQGQQIRYGQFRNDPVGTDPVINSN